MLNYPYKHDPEVWDDDPRPGVTLDVSILSPRLKQTLANRKKALAAQKIASQPREKQMVRA